MSRIPWAHLVNIVASVYIGWSAARLLTMHAENEAMAKVMVSVSNARDACCGDKSLCAVQYSDVPFFPSTYGGTEVGNE